MAGFGAFKLVRNVSGRVGSLLGLTPLGELPRRLGPPSADVPTGATPAGPAATRTEPGWAGAEPVTGEAADAESMTGPDSSVEDAGATELDAGRLDAALERLRAASDPHPEDD